MGQTTEISWCHHTFNPWWGCQRVSPGCERCYAETMAKRYGHIGQVAQRRAVELLDATPDKPAGEEGDQPPGDSATEH